MLRLKEMGNKIKVIALVLLIIIGFSWWGLNSVSIANKPGAIKARNFYYLQLLPKIGLDQRKLTYTIFPFKKDSQYGYYTYSLLGRFESIDFPNRLIYLKDNLGQTYAFNFLVIEPVNRPDLIFFTYQDWSKAGPLEEANMIIDPVNPEDSFSKFFKGDIIEIQWEDFRTIDKILTKTSDNEILIERGEAVLRNSPQVINRYLYEN